MAQPAGDLEARNSELTCKTPWRPVDDKPKAFADGSWMLPQGKLEFFHLKKIKLISEI